VFQSLTHLALLLPGQQAADEETVVALGMILVDWLDWSTGIEATFVHGSVEAAFHLMTDLLATQKDAAVVIA
jgi:hypothetical protein